MAAHKEPEHGPREAEPGRGAPPPKGAEPSRGASASPKGSEPPPGTSPPTGAGPGDGSAPTAGTASGQGGSTAADQAKPAAEPEQPASAARPVAPAEAAAVQGEAESVAAELDAKMAELEDRWLRAVADMDNLRKRMVRDIERGRAEERARVAREFLPVLDNLDLALEHADAEPARVAEGVRAIREQAIGVLNRLGYPRRDEEGVPFDPTRHDAVSTAATPDAEPGTVFKVLRPGYGDGDRQLRPAMVVVATEGKS